MTRSQLPQLTGNGVFVTDGGLETELVFHDGMDLPAFAAFPLLDNPETRARLRRYYDGYLVIARDHGAGFVVETPTWRANPDWAAQLGYSPERLDAVNRAVRRCTSPRRFARPRRPTVSPRWSAAAWVHAVTATTRPTR